VHGRTMHLRALDNASLYKGCEGEIPHFPIVFLSLQPKLSLLSLSSLSWSEVADGEKKEVGVPPARWSAIAPPRRSPFFIFFFKFLHQKLPLLLLITDPY